MGPQKVTKLDLSGKKFGNISILSRAATNVRNWIGVCDCTPDKQREFNGSRLAAGKITHCGCQRSAHGHTAKKSRSPTYVSWQDMKARHKASKGKGHYGAGKYARAYDARWKDFAVFLADMGERPPGTTLDRIDPLNGVYYKDNCRWATRVEQDYNRTDTIMYDLGGRITGSALDWSRWFSKRLGKEMSVEDFKGIVKYFTVDQLWSSLHPQAPTVQQLRDAADASSLAEKRRLHAEAMAAISRENAHMRGEEYKNQSTFVVYSHREDDNTEDTGQVEEISEADMQDWEDAGWVRPE
jgi:hypothetical protein